MARFDFQEYSRSYKFFIRKLRIREDFKFRRSVTAHRSLRQHSFVVGRSRAADPNGKARHSLRVTARLGDGLRHGHIDAVAPALSHQQAADVHAVTDKAL